MAKKLIVPTTLFVIFTNSLVLYLSLLFVILHYVLKPDGAAIILNLLFVGNFIITIITALSAGAAEIAETKNSKFWIKRSAASGLISCIINFVLFSIGAGITGELDVVLALFLFVVYLAVALISSFVGSGLVVLFLKKHDNK